LAFQTGKASAPRRSDFGDGWKSAAVPLLAARDEVKPRPLCFAAGAQNASAGKCWPLRPGWTILCLEIEYKICSSVLSHFDLVEDRSGGQAGPQRRVAENWP
jgi:hypothetical protein